MLFDLVDNHNSVLTVGIFCMQVRQRFKVG